MWPRFVNCTRVLCHFFLTQPLRTSPQTKGDEIRALKDSGADKATVKPFVDELLSLKAKLEPPAEPKKVRKG